MFGLILTACSLLFPDDAYEVMESRLQESWADVDEIKISRARKQTITDAQAANGVTELWHVKLNYIAKPHSTQWEDIGFTW